MAQIVADRRSSAVKDFLKTILLLELWVGLWVTLKNQFRPHITVEYPKESEQQAAKQSKKVMGYFHKKLI